MAKTIWKFDLQPQPIQDIQMPAGAEIICAAEQFGAIRLWARCNPAAPIEPRRIAIVATGGAAPEGEESRYIGTVLTRGGNLVLHVFERRA